MFNSDAKQDQFVANMLKFKKDGTYLDIGSCDSTCSNNTYFFDNIGWRGICIEMDSKCNNSYVNRKNCNYLNEDATKVDYLKILDGYPEVIDYLSLDVDTLSLSVLDILPLDKYKFRVITIEHDSYLYGNEYKKPQREILTKAGYELICSDVFVEQYGFNQPMCSFEDWWIYPSEFDNDLINKIKSENNYPSQILNKFL